MSANPSLSSPVRDAPSDLDAVSIPTPVPDRPTSPVVEVESLDKIYEPLLPWQKGVQALTDVTLSIYPGEAFGLVGPNRAGKTTFLKILLSLCWPTSGQVTRFGEPAACRRSFGRESRGRFPAARGSRRFGGRSPRDELGAHRWRGATASRSS